MQSFFVGPLYYRSLLRQHQSSFSPHQTKHQVERRRRVLLVRERVNTQNDEIPYTLSRALSSVVI